MSVTIPETLLVVGSGICGLQIALMARRAGFHRVIVLERSPLPYAGASLQASTLQTGGQYPLSPKTAADCLHGAIAFRQVMPDFVYASGPAQLFVVTRESEHDPRCASFAAVVGRYQALRPAYRRVLTRYCKLTGARPAVAQQALLGDPRALGVVVDAEKLMGAALGPHVGGVVGGERGLNQPVLGSFLLECARHDDVEIILGARVTRIERRGPGYRAHVAGGGWWDGRHVVVAAWLGSWGITRPPVAASAQLRCVVVVDVARLGFPGRERAIMAMQGPSGAAYQPLDDRRAMLTSARPGASAIRSLATLDPAWAAECSRPLDDADLEAHPNVQKILQSEIEGPFPFLKGTRPLAAFVAPVVRGATADERRYWPPVRNAEGIVLSIPTKATFSTRMALGTLRLLLGDVIARRVVPARHMKHVLAAPADAPIVPEVLRLRGMPRPAPALVARFASARGLSA